MTFPAILTAGMLAAATGLVLRGEVRAARRRDFCRREREQALLRLAAQRDPLEVLFEREARVPAHERPAVIRSLASPAAPARMVTPARITYVTGGRSRSAVERRRRSNLRGQSTAASAPQEKGTKR